jgi:anti-sigma factor ChrR (cupin superfamily)
MKSPIVLTDLLTLAQNPERLPWQPFRPGVDIHWLYQDETTQSQAALLRYQAGARVPTHEHLGYEHIIVLAGSQGDRHGRYFTGTLVINSPTTTHQVSSEEGCIVLIIWTKPVKILSDS